MSFLRPINEDGWIVPREGTKSKMIYDLLRVGMKATAIHRFMPEGTSLGTIRVLICKIRHPRPLYKDRPRYAGVATPSH